MTIDKTSVRDNQHAHFINLMLFKLIIFIRFKVSVKNSTDSFFINQGC